VIVAVYWPRAAVLLAVSVIVLGLVLETGFGAKVAVTPLGKPAMERLTLPVNPY
jgi:hypothetical protein